MKQLYILTDGKEIFAVRAMTYGEWVQERRSAVNATAGNVNWESVAPEIPVSPSCDLYDNRKFQRIA